MELSLVKAAVSDCQILYDMQIECFKPLLDKYQDFITNPGAEKLERTISRLNETYSDYYFIRLDDINIGAIRIVCAGDICRLKQIYILPEYQGKGFAQQAITQAERLYPSAQYWELDTIKQETKHCHLYEKMGYKQTGREERIKDEMTLVFYRK